MGNILLLYNKNQLCIIIGWVNEVKMNVNHGIYYKTFRFF